MQTKVKKMTEYSILKIYILMKSFDLNKNRPFSDYKTTKEKKIKSNY
jgi:hypothetical protein